ncbi:DUF3037 domain-containing protein [Rubrivirga sp.]|uniref:DUF3037 domain-containing protein n=1 Tax=Rubrivirga sp. TaxID=1885344 RepID=UPI003C773BFD
MRPYDYALIRCVDVATGDARTIGVVLSCRQARFLGVRFVDGTPAADALGLDPDLLSRSVRAFVEVANGGHAAGPVGRLPDSERFHFLTATRSTSLQPSSVHTGLADDPEAALDRLEAQALRP